MILPATHCEPPLFFTPSIFGLESLPFCVLPPAFFDALHTKVLSI